jgi:hypothetical protein
MFSTEASKEDSPGLITSLFLLDFIRIIIQACYVFLNRLFWLEKL